MVPSAASAVSSLLNIVGPVCAINSPEGDQTLAITTSETPYNIHFGTYAGVSARTRSSELNGRQKTQ